jgi:hypothetical protein
MTAAEVLLWSSAIVPQRTQGCNSFSAEDLEVRTLDSGLRDVTTQVRGPSHLRYSCPQSKR